MASDVKWIKISTDIFDDEKFDAIEALSDKQMIQLAWIKLLCLAGKCNNSGFLTISNEIPYTNEMLANRFKMSVGDIQRALDFFQHLGMIEVVDNIYMVSNWLKHQNGDSLEEFREKQRERQKKYREKQKQQMLEDKSKKRNVTDNVTDNVTSDVFCSISISYSYSINNSNIDNYKILIDKDIYKDNKYIKDNQKLYTIIKEWMEYKDARKPKSKHHYDTEQGMKKLLTEIINKDKEYGTDVIVDIINRTIAAQYDGIGWFWLKEYGETKKSSDYESVKEKFLNE